MMVCDEEFNNGTNRFVNLRAASLDLHPLSYGCPASHDQVAIVNLDHAQTASTPGLQSGMITKMWNVDIVFQSYFQDSCALIGNDPATVDSKANLIHQSVTALTRA
jgi:hypothetical protein